MEKLDPAFDIIGGDGVVAISLRSGRKITIESSIEGPANFVNLRFQNLKLFVRNGNFCRSFKPSSFDNGYPCWNQKLNIPVHVYPTKNHPFNSLIFTIEIFNIFPMEQEKSEVIGSLVLHLYDIIPLNELDDSFYFYEKDRLVNAIGSVSMSIRFMYGTFGYGYSMQINDQSLQAKSENKNILFPRIRPKSFGKDFIYTDNKIAERNIDMEKRYSNEIENLFNLGSEENNDSLNSTKETRKSRLEDLRKLVLTDHSETASINLDEKTFMRSEQTKMLRLNLVQKK